MILRPDHAADVAALMDDLLDEAGYEPEELIPGLVVEIGRLAEKLPNPVRAVEEAADLLLVGLTIRTEDC